MWHEIWQMHREADQQWQIFSMLGAQLHFRTIFRCLTNVEATLILEENMWRGLCLGSQNMAVHFLCSGSRWTPVPAITPVWSMTCKRPAALGVWGQQIKTPFTNPNIYRPPILLNICKYTEYYLTDCSPMYQRQRGRITSVVWLGFDKVILCPTSRLEEFYSRDYGKIAASHYSLTVGEPCTGELITGGITSATGARQDAQLSRHKLSYFPQRGHMVIPRYKGDLTVWLFWAGPVHYHCNPPSPA